ncbi:hypothetical protein LMG27952_04771 [Paraburkholderia hiiakae]|uniref:Uncharacterized protein n=1 Tax=Paraburkholderia hiiakae TaxID=1081782 RepID=A0ABN7I1N1_9BURK|nr:hypothetical protein [Paraburkholderia hiiakae]CAD6548698.1 hypothetical protein LMG27952_04771 [Paraburkholderia hiiakae]
MEQVTRFAYRCNSCRNVEHVAVENRVIEPAGASCSFCGAPVTAVPVDGEGGFPDPYAVAWWDEAMHASVWWSSRRVKHEDAAGVLCRVDTLSTAPSEPADPDAYRVLLHEFAALHDVDPVTRTLPDWLDIARKAGWKYDRWIDQWLMAKGADQAQAKQEGPAGGSPLPSQPEGGPLPLPSRVIAAAFDGLNAWDQKQWSRNLGDPPHWLARARRTPGRRSPVGGATWDPVRIALALFDREVSLLKLDRVFEQASLRLWNKEWVEKSDYLR